MCGGLIYKDEGYKSRYKDGLLLSETKVTFQYGAMSWYAADLRHCEGSFLAQ